MASGAIAVATLAAVGYGNMIDFEVGNANFIVLVKSVSEEEENVDDDSSSSMAVVVVAGVYIGESGRSCSGKLIISCLVNDYDVINKFSHLCSKWEHLT